MRILSDAQIYKRHWKIWTSQRSSGMKTLNTWFWIWLLSRKNWWTLRISSTQLEKCLSWNARRNMTYWHSSKLQVPDWNPFSRASLPLTAWTVVIGTPTLIPLTACTYKSWKSRGTNYSKRKKTCDTNLISRRQMYKHCNTHWTKLRTSLKVWLTSTRSWSISWKSTRTSCLL